MITVGSPIDLRASQDFGRFDIARLVFYYNNLASHQIENLYDIGLEPGSEEDLNCCMEKNSKWHMCMCICVFILSCLYIVKFVSW